MRAAVIFLCRLVLRLYFRRIELTGLSHVPPSGPVVFILNHPNGLLDPVFVLCLSGRRVSFLAKEPLFRMPVVGWFVRALQSLPVHRARDGGDPAQNRQMLERAVALLSGGNALAIFPEGTSHSDPDLRPFRSGAARIALAASAMRAARGETEAVSVVPCGLYYNRKARFRSNAVLNFGPALSAPVLPLDAGHEPPQSAAVELTRTFEKALRAVTVHASSMEALQLAARAERLLRGADTDEGREPNPRDGKDAQRWRTRQQLIKGYEQLRSAEPERLAAALERFERFEDFVEGHGLRVEQRVVFPTRELMRGALLGIAVGALLLPWAAWGLLANLMTYRGIAWLSGKVSKGEEDVIATAKVLGGLLLYPFTWFLQAAVMGAVFGWLWGLLYLVLSPVAALSALAFVERATRQLTHSVVLTKLLLRPGLRRQIVLERAALRAMILELADHLP